MRGQVLNLDIYRVGHIFQGRYKALLVQKDSHLHRKIREAVERHGYSQKEIADYLKMHYSTISRLVNQK